MTHKDFVLIAAALAASRCFADDRPAEYGVGARTQMDVVINKIASALASTNPRFDYSRFIAAAEGTPSTKRDVVRS